MHDKMQPDGPLILVAEDDRALRDLLDSLLTDEGYRVLTAADGVEALAIGGRSQPDVILLDLNLPLMNGPELCRAYREGGGEAPVVLVTAADPTLVAEAMDACVADAYIGKPFDIEAVLATVARFVKS